jgi:hypothetical protein
MKIETIVWGRSQIVRSVHIRVKNTSVETQNNQETLGLPHSALLNRSTAYARVSNGIKGSTPVRGFDLRIGHFRSVFQASALKVGSETKCGEPVILYRHFAGTNCETLRRDCNGIHILQISFPESGSLFKFLEPEGNLGDAGILSSAPIRHSYIESLLAFTELLNWHRRNIDLYNHVMTSRMKRGSRSESARPVMTGRVFTRSHI